ncbi:hypothetical protein RFI_22196, partial [Reticulomyxa filosa]
IKSLHKLVLAFLFEQQTLHKSKLTRLFLKDDLFVYYSLSYPKRKYTKVKFLANTLERSKNIHLVCEINQESIFRDPNTLKENSSKLDIRVLFWTNDKRIC